MNCVGSSVTHQPSRSRKQKEKDVLPMKQQRPAFDDIKSYEEFKEYKWVRTDLVNICKDHGLLFIGTEKKLLSVIEAYYNGEKIPPRRAWYTNPILRDFVNENGILLSVNLVITGVSLILIAVGILNRVRQVDDLYSVPFLVFGITGMIVAIIWIYFDRDVEVLRSYWPKCGDQKFTREQVDEQANAKTSVNMGYADLILAPDMVIGASAGVVAVAYDDIVSLQVKKSEHTKSNGKRRHSYTTYFVYEIVVTTRKGKKVVVSKSQRTADSALQTIYDHCLKRGLQVKYLVKDQQVTSGESVKNSVKAAETAGFLQSIMVSDELKNRFVQFHMMMAADSVVGSICVSGSILLVLSFFVTNWISFWGILVLLVLLAFPFFMFWNFFTLIILFRKNDQSFYLAEIVQRHPDGYEIKGVGRTCFGFIQKLRPEKGPDIGDRVILARVEDRFSLIGYDRLSGS